MIRNSFSIIGGVGEKTERRLWEAGYLTWDDFVASSGPPFLSDARKRMYDETLLEAEERLKEKDEVYFSRAMKRSEHWRLFDVFGGEAVCLDIESNGWHAEAGGYPTVVGLYDGYDFQAHVWGEGLSAEGVMEALSGFKYLITFYGSVFDIPFLEKSLPGFHLDMPHFDLCFGAKKVGLAGGLKKLEVKLGIRRSEDTVGIDGYEAVLLWERARRGDSRAMDLLVKYNREDTVNLMEMAQTVYGRLRSSTGIEEYIQTW
jgi:uncharacterized protein YprB with RNaseH-like and TPR domain